MWSTTGLLQQLELASEPELGLQDTVNSGKKWLLISMLENSTFSFDRGNNIVSINVKMDGPVLEEKSYFKILGCLYLLSWIRAFTSSPLLNLPPKNWSLDSFFEVFFFPEVALYLYKSIISCMEYRCHVWTGSPNCYLEMIGNLEKWICRTFRPSPAAFLKLLDHRRNITSLSFFYR